MYVKGTKLIDKNGRIINDSLDRVILAMPHEAFAPSFERAVRAFVCSYIYKVEILHPDETPCMDISEYVLEDTLSYSQQFQEGQSRSLSFDLYDEKHEFFPSPVGRIWFGTKVRILFGLLVDDSVYYFQKGIFAVKDCSYNSNILSIQFADKFGFLDGSISGAAESEYKLQPGTPVKTAVESLLYMKDADGNNIYDSKRIVFPEKYETTTIPYTVTATPGSNIGNIILELAEIISCTVYYDDYGSMVFEPSEELSSFKKRPIMWRYADKEYQFSDSRLHINFADVYNKIMVVGSNINGYICKYTAENTNPASPTSTDKNPIRFKYISDSNIYNDDLCKTRAEYELQKQSLLSTPLSFRSIYIPFLTVNDIVTYTDRSIRYHNDAEMFNDENLLITGISIQNGEMNIDSKNIKELPFYG